MHYEQENIELENELLKLALGEGKMTLRRFLAIFELNALSSIK